MRRRWGKISHTKIRNILIIVGVSVIAGGILLISLVRSSLEMVKKDEKEGQFRVVPVISQGEIIYKLPYVHMLPGQRGYRLKEIRDWLWEAFSFGSKDKIEVNLLLADKAMAEMVALSQKQKEEAAFESGIKAINKLKYTVFLNQGEVGEAGKIEEVKEAYKEIIDSLKEKEEISTERYTLLKYKLNEITQSQEI